MYGFPRFPFEGIFVLIALFFSFIPLLLAVWFLFKIHSIDTTLKEVSRKLDRLKTGE